jgi:predicted nucleic acid-binding protein
MSMVEVWDTSALIVAARHPDARAVLADALAKDEVAITEAITLEYLNGARSLADYDRDRARLGAFRQLDTTPSDWQRALDVHRRLAAIGAGHQRSVQVLDLVIAAVAERAGCAVVHVDQDYDLIGAITGQAVRRLPWRA